MNQTNQNAQVAVRRPTAPTRPTGNVFGLLQREVDRLFDEFGHSGWLAPSGASGAFVRMDLADTKDGFELTVEVPGLDEKDVHVTLSDRLLTVSGEKTATRDSQGKDYRLSERSYGAFSRSIDLPAEVDADRIAATLHNGVLKLNLPRSVQATPKQIEIKTAA